MIRERLCGFFDVDLVHRFGGRGFFFEADPFVAGGLAPGGHVFLDAFVVGENFETWPVVSSLIFLEVRMMGMGQKYPRVSSVTSDWIIIPLTFPLTLPSPARGEGKTFKGRRNALLLR